MRTMSAALKEHLAGEVTTMCTCWCASLRNGKTLGFTDHTRNLTFEGQLYKSTSGYTPTAVEASGLLNVDTLEVEGLLDGVDIREDHLLAGLWDNANISIFWVNYMDLSMGKLVMKVGTIGQITVKGTSFVAEVRGLTQAYTTMIGELTSPLCRANFGDARCKKNISDFTYLGTVQSVGASNRSFTDNSLTQSGPSGSLEIASISRAKRAVVTLTSDHTFGSGSNIFITGVIGVVQSGAMNSAGTEFLTGSGASINNYTYGIADVTSNSFSIPLDTRLANDNSQLGPEPSMQYSSYVSGGAVTPQGDTGYFTSGKVTFTSGKNQGLSMEVKGYVPGVVDLQLPMPYRIAVGDTYRIEKGCNKRFIEDCKDTYDNAINFRGEPHLPGLDQVIQIGNRLEPPGTEA